MDGLLALFRSITLAERCMIVLPVACYWTYSSFFYLISSLNLTSVQIHRIPGTDTRSPNSVTPKQVVTAVAWQHLFQMCLAVGLALFEEESNRQRQMESWPLVLLKLGLAALFLDTYQVQK